MKKYNHIQIKQIIHGYLKQVIGWGLLIARAATSCGLCLRAAASATPATTTTMPATMGFAQLQNSLYHKSKEAESLIARSKFLEKTAPARLISEGEGSPKEINLIGIRVIQRISLVCSRVCGWGLLIARATTTCGM